MQKLILRESCFTGIENAITKEIKRTPDHKIFEKQEKEQIEKNRIKYEIAYNNARSYFAD